MYQSFKTILILPLLVLFIAIGVYFNASEPAINNSKQCELDETLTCRFNLAERNTQQVIVKFVKKVQVEEQNEMVLILPPDTIVENVWIQGVNMYMGKIAVFELPATEQSQLNQHHLQFFLGSCSEANMRWQMVLVIKTASDTSITGQAVTRQSETYFINFKTQIS